MSSFDPVAVTWHQNAARTARSRSVEALHSVEMHLFRAIADAHDEIARALPGGDRAAEREARSRWRALNVLLGNEQLRQDNERRELERADLKRRIAAMIANAATSAAR